MTERGWLRPPDVDQDAAVRLFAIPHAGGGAVMYREWSDLLPPDIAVQAVQLPGRQDRMDEPPYTEIEPLVTVLAEEVGAELDGRPYALFGHSMGALLAYRLALRLVADGAEPPLLVGVAGWAPVGFTMPTIEQLSLTEDALVDWLISIGSLAPELRWDPEVRALMPPTRADLAVCADYVDDGAVAPCPVVAYTGNADRLLAAGAITSWTPRCSEFLGTCQLPGNHFFINDHGLAITLDLTRHLRRRAAVGGRV
jgi:surfactin synthase thioesterase subunit